MENPPPSKKTTPHGIFSLNVFHVSKGFSFGYFDPENSPGYIKRRVYFYLFF